MAEKKSSATKLFDVGQYLATSGVKKKVAVYRKGQDIFSQGEECRAVFYLQSGAVKITVVSTVGKEAVVALLRPGDFFGEGCIAGQPLRVQRRPPLSRRRRWKSKRKK